MGKILEYLLRWGWDIIFQIRLDKFLDKIPFLRKYVCKQRLIRGGVEYDPENFLNCAAGGRLKEVKLFTCAGIHVNIPDSDGNTALILAVLHDHREVVEHLLSLTAKNKKLTAKDIEIDADARNHAGDTALVIATRTGNLEMVDLLLAHEKIDVNVSNKAGDTALIIAARENHSTIFAKLITHPCIDVHVRNRAAEPESALLEAARREYQDMLRQLQEKGAMESQLEKKVARWQLQQMGIFNDPSFLNYVKKGQIDLVAKFLVAGQNPNVQDDNGDTSLIIATWADNLEMVDLLVAQEEIKVNLSNGAGDTALIIAARENHSTILAKLIRHPRIDVHVRNRAAEPESALLEAARREYQDMVRQLQEKGAMESQLEKKVARWQLQQMGIFNDPSFLNYVKKGQIDLVAKFLAAGQNPNVQDNGDTALIFATRAGNLEMVNLLLAHEKIDVNLANDSGDTALIIAARQNQGQIIARLLEHPKIDVNARNKAKEEESALLEAARREYEDIAQQLRDKGAEEPQLVQKVARWQLDQKGEYDEEHFVRAVGRGNIDLARKYLQAGMDANAQDDQREAALIVAVRHRQPDMVKLLLAQPGINVGLPNRDGVRAIEMAAARDYEELVQLLRDAGADAADLRMVYKRRLQDIGLQFRPDVFITQSAKGEEKLVALFLDAGMHPNTENDQGDTALMEAARNGQKEIVQLLIDRKAEVNLRNGFGVSALEAAERSGHAEVVELLFQHGANPTEPTKESLLVAIEAGNRRGVEAALDRGITPDVYTEGGEPILIVAVRQRQYEIADVLLRRKIKVDAKDRDQKTALMRAAELGATDMIRLLLKDGANLEETDPQGSTPLLLAVWNGQAKAAQLLKEMGANIDVQDLSGRSLQMIAQRKGHPEILRLLKAEKSLEADLLAAAARGDYAEVATLIAAKADPEVPDEAGNTPVALAAARGWTQVIEALNPNKRLLEKANGEGDTPLMQAARGGHLSTVEFLLGKEININAVNQRGETALLQAAMAGRGAVVEALANAKANPKADPNLTSSGTTPLLEACFHGQLEAVRALLENGADVNQPLEYGFSPLMTAMLAGHEHIADELRNRNVTRGELEGQVFLNTLNGNEKALTLLNLGEINLNARDREGWTALMIASREGYDSIAKKLLNKEKEVETSVRSRDGKTTALLEAAIHGRTGVLKLLIPASKPDATVATNALIEAAAYGHAEAVRLLAEKTSANINGRSKGRVPLVEAAGRGHIQVVQVLLGLGADKHKKSQDGLTAIMAAQLHGHEEVVALLVERGLKEGLKDASLLLAARNGDDKEVERLLSLAEPPDIHARDEEGRTAVMLACQEGHFIVVTMLLGSMGAQRAPVAAGDHDYRKRTPLMFAARGGNVQIVDTLLGLNVDIHAESSDKRTALIEACKRGRYAIVDKLLKPLDNDSRKVAVNHEDANRNTPLSETLLEEDPRRQAEYAAIVKLLTSYGAERGRDFAEFLHAVQKGELAQVKKLIDQVDFKRLRLHGKTPLMLCAQAGHGEMADFLIKKGVDVNDTDQQGITAMMLAVNAKQRHIVQLLLKNGADCDRLDSKESNALIRAVQQEDIGMVSDLLSANANVNHRDSAGDTALIVAVNKNKPALVQLLLAGRYKPNLDGLDKDRRTALTLARLRGSCSCIHERNLPPSGQLVSGTIAQKLNEIELLLLKAGARNGWDEAEFIHSVQKGDSANMQTLLEEGVDVNIRDLNGSTALLIACQRDDWQAFDILLKHNASVNVRNYDNRTPLMEAAKQKQNSLKFVAGMYQADPNLDLNAQDKNGETALLEAARAGIPATVLFLVEKGANVNAVNRRGAAPIIEMAKHPYANAVDALLQHGANACARDADYDTAILEAARQGHAPILKNLLEHLKERLKADHRKRKAVINAIDQKSHTALDWARQGGFTECVSLLQEHGGLAAGATSFMVVVTLHGTHYHQKDCWTIRNANKDDPIALRDAIRWNYEMCDVCKPSLEIIDWSC